MSSPDYSSDSSSGPSSDHSSPSRVCPYRNARFHDQECSRYFDCPSHQVERARSEAAAPDNNHLEDRQDVDEGDASHSSRISPQSSEDEPARAGLEADPEADNAGQDVIDLTVSSPSDNQPSPEESRIAAVSSSTNNQSNPEEFQFGEAQDSDNERGGAELLQQGGSLRDPVVIDLTADSSDEPSQPGPSSSNQNPERALPTLPQSASASSIISHRSAGPGSPSFSRRPATPPSPPPASRRRTSSNAFAATRAVHQPQRPPESRRPSDLVLPRWQPDAEVTFCPICHTQFSIFIRKHHCRKCGRVVCNSCSPHRITIPYQYIVHPPGTPRPGAQRHSSSFLSGEGMYADFSSLGGGEKVRLCNPCVPDPNTNPPDSQESPGSRRIHSRSQSGASGVATHGPGLAPQGRPTYFATRVDDPYGRNRSVTMLPDGSRQASGSRSYQYQPTQSRILSGTPPTHYPYALPSASSSYRAMRHRSMIDAGQSSSSMAAASRRPLPPDPPQVAEEDECPVCHRELPSRDLANFEALRERHINICISSHSAYGTPSGEGSSMAPRRTGMFPYVATEKDCVDSAECTICLEEFEVGDPMARLECFCRFHKDCISRWFAKNPGRCPVHQHAIP
ncbi:hypothetical protein KVR01_005523 [Diaporthe batatas]|uniref:uncharacterized protein n=1 Tax=Diaporthe batatas TaxID=748121 RepID=UPI001D044899|nr:uncharacterized protein KVR01_005523 [Diaporthe batatas]KAG8165248.1 hypothetical protein KVR01_005523 [Diaporthe batatas]